MVIIWLLYGLIMGIFGGFHNGNISPTINGDIRWTETHLAKAATDPQAKEGTARQTGTLHMVEVILFLGPWLKPLWTTFGAKMAWKNEGFHR